MALRFTRPDSSAVFGPGGSVPDRGGLLRFWASRLADPGLEQVARWWFPSRSDRRRDQAAPPLPAFGSGRLPLAILRADWSATGDLLAIDGRGASRTDRLEWIGRGQRLLGPDWSSGLAPSGPPRARHWATGPNADLFEWGSRAGGARVTRTALLLRGRELALIAEQVDGASRESAWRVDLAPGVEASPAAEGRAVALASGRVAARALPIALDERSGRGSLAVEGGALVLRQAIEGRRAWLPLLVSWRAERNRKPARWRVLTVTEKGRICPPDVAFAARVSWGMDEALVFYRSLGPARPRAFLGHQTSARFLVGAFGRTGRVEPLATIED